MTIPTPIPHDGIATIREALEEADERFYNIGLYPEDSSRVMVKDALTALASIESALATAAKFRKDIGYLCVKDSLVASEKVESIKALCEAVPVLATAAASAHRAGQEASAVAAAFEDIRKGMAAVETIHAPPDDEELNVCLIWHQWRKLRDAVAALPLADNVPASAPGEKEPISQAAWNRLVASNDTWRNSHAALREEIARLEEAFRITADTATKVTTRLNEVVDERDALRAQVAELTAQRDAARAALSQLVKARDGIDNWKMPAGRFTMKMPPDESVAYSKAMMDARSVLAARDAPQKEPGE